jgi:hypothetical protein
MDHARAALDALEREHDDVNVMRALETAAAVSYGRAFSTSDLLQLDRHAYRPADPKQGQLHDNLIWLRNKVYPHTDPAGGRTASIENAETTITRNAEGTEISIAAELREQWSPLRREAIPEYCSVIEYSVSALHERDGHSQRVAAHLDLDGEVGLSLLGMGRTCCRRRPQRSF